MPLIPTIFIDGERLQLDVGHYSRLVAGDTVGNRIHIDPAGDAQCDGCGRNISETGFYEGNPSIRTEKGYDDCSVICEECTTGYPVVWKEQR